MKKQKELSKKSWKGDSQNDYETIWKQISSELQPTNFLGYEKYLVQGKVLKNLQPNEIGNIELNLPLLEKNKQQYKKDLIFLLLLITYIFTFFVLRKFKI